MINQKPVAIAVAIAAAIAVETAVVTAAAAANNVVGDDVGNNDMTWLSMADNGGVDGSGQQHGRRRWLGQRWTQTNWSLLVLLFNGEVNACLVSCLRGCSSLPFHW